MSDILEIKAPIEQEGTKATVRAWLKKLGDVVRKDDPIVELETDKVAVEIAAQADGILSEIIVQTDIEVEPGTLLGRIRSAALTTRSHTEEAAPQESHPQRLQSNEILAPGIRKLLQEHSLAAADIPASGGRLTREDIIAEVEQRARSVRPGTRKLAHDAMRKRIAEHLSHSVQVAPHVTSMFEADFSAIVAHRQRHKTQFNAEGANLTFTAYFIAASAAAMNAAPAVNSRWHPDHLELFDDVNIGVGTSLGERGLIVPVIHRAQSLTLLEIARELGDLTERARTGNLRAADVQNGTFSISNHGVSGSLLASPIIINQPQSAILGVGKLEKRVVVRENDAKECMVIRPMSYVTLTIDHRVIDAFQTNAWLTKFVEILENWPLDQ